MFYPRQCVEDPNMQSMCAKFWKKGAKKLFAAWKFVLIAFYFLLMITRQENVENQEIVFYKLINVYNYNSSQNDFF